MWVNLVSLCKACQRLCVRARACLCVRVCEAHVFCLSEGKFPAPGSSSCPQEFPEWADSASWINVVVVVFFFFMSASVCAHMCACVCVLTGSFLFGKGNCSHMPASTLPQRAESYVADWRCWFQALMGKVARRHRCSSSNLSTDREGQRWSARAIKTRVTPTIPMRDTHRQYNCW